MRRLSVATSFVALVALAVLTGVAACVTAARSPEEVAAERRRRLADEMGAFSGALARAGMSVPLPARVCAEPSAPPRWDEEIGCLDVAPGTEARVALTLYARAIVHERLPDAPPARADALVEAYLRDDPSFVTLAETIEAELDARRAAKARAGGTRKAKRAAPPVGPDAGVIPDGGPVDVDGGGAADGGAAAKDGGAGDEDESEAGAPVDEGTEDEGGDEGSDEGGDEGGDEGDDDVIIDVEEIEIEPADPD